MLIKGTGSDQFEIIRPCVTCVKLFKKNIKYIWIFVASSNLICCDVLNW